jgi:hypothetical protein
MSDKRRRAFDASMNNLKAHIAQITPRRVKKRTEDPVHGGQHSEPDGDEDAEGNEPHVEGSVEEALEELQPEPDELGPEEFERHFDLEGDPSDKPELVSPSGTPIDRKKHGKFGKEGKPEKQEQACRGCNAPVDDSGRCKYCGMHN